MFRREYIISVGAAASGIGVGLGTAKPNPEPKRKVTSASGNFNIKDIEAEISIANSSITKEQTAELTLHLVNEGVSNETFTTTIENGVNALIGNISTGNVKAVLIGKLNTWTKTNGEWIAKKSYLNRDSPDIKREFELAPGESFTNTYQIWQMYSAAPNLPKGEYVFNESYQVGGEEAMLEISCMVE